MKFSSKTLISSLFAVAASFAAAIAQEATTSAPPPAGADAETDANDPEAVIARSGVPRDAVAAVVNDKVISTYDVSQRILLTLMAARGQIPADALPQLQQQVLRDLIQEKLKIAETQEFEMDFTDEDFLKEFEFMAAQSNLTPAQLEEVLAQAGVSMQTMRDQVRAGALWPNLVQGRFRDRVRVSDDEVEDTLARLREEASLEQFLVSEICIPVDDPSRAQQYYQGALQLIEQMRRGVPFTIVAQNYSACTTAAVGGDLGWVRKGELAPEIDAAISELPIGAVTNPIPSDGAFLIMGIRDKREAVVAGEPTFTLAYASAPVEVGENAARAAFDKLAAADPCSQRALRSDLGPDIGYALVENVTLSELDPRFSEFVEDLSRGDTMPVIRADGAFHSAYVCEKDEGLGLPSRAALENRIQQRQLSRISQQYLRDLERRAAIDIRLDELLPAPASPQDVNPGFEQGAEQASNPGG